MLVIEQTCEKLGIIVTYQATVVGQTPIKVKTETDNQNDTTHLLDRSKDPMTNSKKRKICHLQKHKHKRAKISSDPTNNEFIVDENIRFGMDKRNRRVVVVIDIFRELFPDMVCASLKMKKYRKMISLKSNKKLGFESNSFKIEKGSSLDAVDYRSFCILIEFLRKSDRTKIELFENTNKYARIVEILNETVTL
jgi:hypothetical protein